MVDEEEKKQNRDPSNQKRTEKGWVTITICKPANKQTKARAKLSPRIAGGKREHLPGQKMSSTRRRKLPEVARKAEKGER